MADGMAGPSLTRRAPPGAAIERGGVKLRPLAGLGAVKLQLFGSDALPRLAAALAAPLPAPGRVVAVGAVDCAWLAPGEWFLLGPEAAVAALAATLEAALDGALFLPTDLSHGQVALQIAGPAARDALASHCPLDLADAAFPTGAAARSLLGEAAIFLDRRPDEDGAACFRLLVDQTLAPYALRLLAGPGDHP